MRFIALVKKELQEILPIMLLAAVAFASIGTYIFWNRLRHPYVYDYWLKEPGNRIGSSWANYPEPLENFGPLLILVSLALGLAVAIRQFAEEEKLKTWAFVIHRSVKRSTILWAKFAAAAIAFVISVGALWTLFYLHACRPALFLYPPTPRTLVQGWMFISLGLLAYAGVTLATAGEKNRYAVKIAGSAFAAVICLLAVINFYCMALSIAIVLFGLIILTANIIDTFLNREF
jgi:ABC-type transport system involved in multi-copper enzyme maturation permease subunit